MIAQQLFEKLDAQLSTEELDHATMFFDYNLSTEASLFEQWGAEVVNGEAADFVLPHLLHTDLHVGYGDIFADWAVQTLKKKETYLYLAMLLFATIIFGRITSAVIEEEKRLALQDLPDMEKTPEPTPEPTPPPVQDTPEPTPPPKEEEPEPEPTPPPKDMLEEEKLEDLAKEEKLEDLKRDDILKDQIRDDLAFEKLAARPADKGSTGVISRKFADTNKHARDNVNLNMKNVGTGKKKDAGAAKPQLGSIGGKGKAKDTGQETLKSLKKDASGKPKGKSDKPTGGKVKWIKLPDIGPVAHLQPRCRGVKGFIVVGKYRLLCSNDQIVSAYVKE